MPTAVDQQPDLTGRRIALWPFLITAVAAFMVALDNLVVVTALPVIRSSFDTGIEGLQWTVSAYTLTYAVCQLSGAALGDRFGRRRIFVAGLALFVAASGAAAVAPTIGLLIVARAVQGLGAALVSPLALTIVAAATPRERRTAVLGVWSGLSGIAIAIGPLVGGAIVTGAPWQWIFLVNVPIGLLLIPAARRKLAETHGPNDRLDVAGAVLASAGLLALVFALINGERFGWSSASILGSFGAAAALAVAFIRRESTALAPMLPLGLFRSRGFAASVTAYLLMAFGLFGSIFLLTQYLQTDLGYSPLTAGLGMLPAAAMPALVAPVTGPIARRFGGRALVTGALLLQATALGWLAVVSRPDTGYLAHLPALMLLGAAAGLFFGQISRLILGFVPARYEGMASGTGTTFRQLGTTLGVAVLGAVFATTGGYTDSVAFSAGLRPALGFAAVVSTVGALVGLLVPVSVPTALVQQTPAIVDQEEAQ